MQELINSDWLRLHYSEEVCLIGEGPYSRTYSFLDQRDKAQKALKIIRVRKEEDRNFRTFEKIKEFSYLFQSLDNKNILLWESQYLEIENERIFIIMPFAEKNLQTLMQEKESFTKPELHCIFQSLFTGLNHAHGKNISHRNLKPTNILINKSGILQISDWGIANNLERRGNVKNLAGIIGSTEYYAPEVLNLSKSTSTINFFKADIYSLGLIMIKCCGIEECDFSINLNRASSKEEHDKEFECLLLTNISSRYPEYFLLLKKMCKYNPTERIDLSDAIKQFSSIKIFEEERKPSTHLSMSETNKDAVASDRDEKTFTKTSPRFEKKQPPKGVWNYLTNFFCIGCAPRPKSLKDKPLVKIHFNSQNIKEESRNSESLKGSGNPLGNNNQNPQQVIWETELPSDKLKDLLAVEIFKTNVLDLEEFDKNRNFLKVWAHHDKKIDDDAAFQLTKSIKDFKKLKELDISFERTLVGDDGISFLATAIVELEELTDLKLYMKETLVGDKGVSKLAESIRGLKELKHLTLGFNLTDLGNNGVISLSHSIKELKEIKNLELHLMKTNIGNEALEVFSNSLKNLKRTTHLKINLRKTQVGDQGIECLSDGIIHLREISSISLHFRETLIGDRGLERIAIALEDMTNINSLILALDKTRINDHGIISISRAIKSLVNLNVFNISANHTNIQDNGLCNLADAVKYLKSLTTLTLVLGYTMITDLGIALIESAIRDLRGLKSLIIGLQGTEISDKGIEGLANSCRSILDLSYLELYLGGTKITDIGVRSISNSLSHLKSLQNLELYLSHIEITDLSLENIANGLKNLKLLNKVHFDFRDSKITDEGKRRFEKSLKVQKFSLEDQN